VEKTRVAIVGWGNVGRGTAEAVVSSPDFELAAVVRRNAEPGQQVVGHGWSAPAVTSLADTPDVVAALVCLPTRLTEAYEIDVLRSGVSVVDSFDIHGEALWAHRQALDAAARKGGAVAVTAAGWDPGTDSMVRCIMEALAPRGVTYTDFGPGMSMGHSVAARSVKGVADALSFTLPTGFGTHRRQVYVQLDGSRPFEAVAADIKSDPYFAHDDTHVTQVESAVDHHDTGHGVSLKRFGAAGTTGNQQMEWTMRVVNPAATGCCMLSALRAGLRQEPGAYTMAELPPAHMLPGSLESIVKRIV
jgi:diaminopimelate dehydrogenase